MISCSDPLQPGDRLLIHPVGAYNISQSTQFIVYRPAVVMIGVEGQIDVIRRRRRSNTSKRSKCCRNG